MIHSCFYSYLILQDTGKLLGQTSKERRICLSISFSDRNILSSSKYYQESFLRTMCSGLKQKKYNNNNNNKTKEISRSPPPPHVPHLPQFTPTTQIFLLLEFSPYHRSSPSHSFIFCFFSPAHTHSLTNSHSVTPSLSLSPVNHHNYRRNFR
jgi:hypothetical protein